MQPIYLIRHGETALNANRTLQPPATPLSERGLAQAARLGARMRPLRIARVLASDLARAAMTAEALRSATGAPLEFDAELHERDFGDWRGTPYDQLGFDPFAEGMSPPNGETWEVFHDRVARAWRNVLAVAARTDGPLAVVTHGLVCRGVIAFHAPPAPSLAPPASFRNTSVSVLEGGPAWRATLIDCVAHLDDARETGAA
jgi:probable phosphoglycerate mutase